MDCLLISLNDLQRVQKRKAKDHQIKGLSVIVISTALLIENTINLGKIYAKRTIENSWLSTKRGRAVELLNYNRVSRFYCDGKHRG